MSEDYADRYSELERYITRDHARAAFRTLLATDRYDIYPNRTKLAVNFRDGALPHDPTPYAFIVAREWLKFYLRKEAFEPWQPLERELRDHFGARFDRSQYESNEKKAEWRVQLADVDDVEFLYGLCPAAPYPLVLRI